MKKQSTIIMAILLMTIVMFVALSFAQTLSKPAVQTLNYTCNAPANQSCTAVRDVTVGVCRDIAFNTTSGPMEVMVCDKDDGRYELYLKTYPFPTPKFSVCVGAGCVGDYLAFKGYDSFNSSQIPQAQPQHPYKKVEDLQVVCAEMNCSAVNDKTVGYCRYMTFRSARGGESDVLLCHKEDSRYELYLRATRGQSPSAVCTDGYCVGGQRGFNSFTIHDLEL